jgi:hypothetical protein
MRRATLLHAVLFLWGTACGNFLDFDVTVPIPEQKVPGATPGALGALLPLELLPPVPINLRQTRDFKEQDVGELRSVRLTSMRLALTEESTQRDFNWVDRIQIDARRKNASNTIHIAGLSDVPADVSALELETTRNELIDTVGTDFEILVTLEGRFPTQEAIFDGKAVFELEADPESFF